MGLVNLGILAGFATLAVPIVIHLLRSRRFVTADLGSLRFLKVAVKESVRWRRLRDLLLLLARLLAVALLTLLFARPFVRQPGAAGDADRDVVLLLDASGSMDGRALGVTNSALARDTALNVLDDLPESARVTLALFADRVRETEEVAAANLAPGGRTDYRTALSWAADRLALSDRKRKDVVLITDLQRAGVPNDPIPDWPLDVGVAIVRLSQPGPFNAGIAEVRNLSPYVERQGTIEVRLACFGEYPEVSSELVLEIAGQEVQKKTVPLRNTSVEFQWTPKGPGTYRGLARVAASDAYPRDDVRYFALSVRAPRLAVLVNGAPGRTPFENESYFLGTALNVALRKDGQSAFSAVERSDLGDIETADVVVLCNVAQLGDDETRRLETFVRNGGGLLFFLGDKCDAGAYSRLRDRHLFPARIAPRRVAVPRQIFEWDHEHPALALFSVRERGDLSRIVFRDAFEVRPDDDAEVMARLSNGTAAVLGASLGRGRIVAVTNPCDRDWTDWPTQRIFLPVVRELLSYLAGPDDSFAAVENRLTGIEETRPVGIHEGNPLVVVNPDPLELDVRPADENAFRNKLGIGTAPADKGIATDTQNPPRAERERELWRYLALALLLVLMIENLLADRGR